MSETPPQPLPYRRPDRLPQPPDPESTWQRFVAGIGIGTAVSAVLWIGGLASRRYVPASVIFGLGSVVVPGTKFVVGLSLLSNPPWRRFGAGLLVSMAVGFMILCGVCWVGMTGQ